MDLRKLPASASQARDQYVDAGPYRTLEVDVRVPSAGAAGNLLLQHAAVPEEDAFRTLLTFPLSGGTPGGYHRCFEIGARRWPCGVNAHLGLPRQEFEPRISRLIDPTSLLAAGDFDNPDGLSEEPCESCGDTVEHATGDEITRFSWSRSIPDDGVVGQEGTFSATGCHLERGGCFPVTTSEGESGHASGRPDGRTDLMPEREARGA